MSANRNLNTAKVKKKDEFYTQLSDIERELKYYRDHFRGKVVYCNCDDPRVSKFFHYFSMKFRALGLKKLITTCYKNQQMDMFSQNDTEKAMATFAVMNVSTCSSAPILSSPIRPFRCFGNMWRS